MAPPSPFRSFGVPAFCGPVATVRCHDEVDVPVSFGDVTFDPGAMLRADAAGVVVLPRST